MICKYLIFRRAVPDVSAIAQVPFFQAGQLDDSAETTGFSASIFASIIALLSNERIVAGKKGLGFLNPLIYQNPGAFKDMPTGWSCRILLKLSARVTKVMSFIRIQSRGGV
jgi:hypothetical protein